MRRVLSAYTSSISARWLSTSAVDQRSADGFHRSSSSGKSRSIISSRIGVFSRSNRAGWMDSVLAGSVVRATPCCMGGPPKRLLHLTGKGRETLNWRIMSNRDRGDAGMGRIVALMDDLFFQMKVAETAKHLGLELKVATNGDALVGLLEPLPN